MTVLSVFEEEDTSGTDEYGDRPLFDVGVGGLYMDSDWRSSVCDRERFRLPLFQVKPEKLERPAGEMLVRISTRIGGNKVFEAADVWKDAEERFGCGPAGYFRGRSECWGLREDEVLVVTGNVDRHGPIGCWVGTWGYPGPMRYGLFVRPRRGNRVLRYRVRWKNRFERELLL